MEILISSDGIWEEGVNLFLECSLLLAFINNTFS